MGQVDAAGCCQTWGQAVLLPEGDEQQLTTAERLSLLTVKAHEYTLQYHQVSTGCLMELDDLARRCNLLCSGVHIIRQALDYPYFKS